MSRFSGPQGEGAQRRKREERRIEAEVRNEAYQERLQQEALLEAAEGVVGA